MFRNIKCNVKCKYIFYFLPQELFFCRYLIKLPRHYLATLRPGHVFPPNRTESRNELFSNSMVQKIAIDLKQFPQHLKIITRFISYLLLNKLYVRNLQWRNTVGTTVERTVPSRCTYLPTCASVCTYCQATALGYGYQISKLIKAHLEKGCSLFIRLVPRRSRYLFLYKNSKYLYLRTILLLIYSIVR